MSSTNETPASGDRDYFLLREKQSRTLAKEAQEPGIQRIHKEMARRYAEQARDKEIG